MIITHTFGWPRSATAPEIAGTTQTQNLLVGKNQSRDRMSEIKLPHGGPLS
jgi:hypothetical protein